MQLGFAQSDQCDSIKSQLDDISSLRTEAKGKCQEKKANELESLKENSELTAFRRSIEVDIETLKTSLACDDSDLKKYFDCHVERVILTFKVNIFFYFHFLNFRPQQIRLL